MDWPWDPRAQFWIQCPAGWPEGPWSTELEQGLRHVVWGSGVSSEGPLCVLLPWGLLHVAVDADTEYENEWAVGLGPVHGDHSTPLAGGGRTPPPPTPRLPSCPAACPSTTPLALRPGYPWGPTWQGQS